ncbi:PREDICTED: uncharacterized protein LOC105558377, partial [Vollenhovia emeryi]|uniref:uncharacterized protein LOC105558377 n=1 Tax=Vollenhovia emeryi TaxID=411798 RepID=UPI0005F3C34D
NNWFDVQNSQVKYGKHPGVNGYGVDLAKQEQTLVLMNLYTESMRVGSRKELMPFQKGILVSNQSIRGLFQYLQRKYPEECQYIITRRLQQDILENFFSYLRGMGSTKDHPSAYDFRYRIRWYVLGKHSQAVFTLNRNTEEDMDTTCMSSSTVSTTTRNSNEQSRTSATPVAEENIVTSTPIRGMTLHASKSNDGFSQVEEELKHTEEYADEIPLTAELFSSIINISSEELLEENNDDENESMNNTCLDIHDDELFQIVQDGFKSSSDCLNLVQEAGLEYVAGFVAHKFKAKYLSLGSTEHEGGTTTKWIQAVSKGYLTNPSAELLNASKVVEKCFTQFHGDYFSKENFVISKVVALVKNSADYLNEIPDEVLQYLVKTRTYIRVREISRRSYAVNEKKKKDKKMKKIRSSTV